MVGSEDAVEADLSVSPHGIHHVGAPIVLEGLVEGDAIIQKLDIAKVGKQNALAEPANGRQ